MCTRAFEDGYKMKGLENEIEEIGFQIITKKNPENLLAKFRTRLDETFKGYMALAHKYNIDQEEINVVQKFYNQALNQKE